MSSRIYWELPKRAGDRGEALADALKMELGTCPYCSRELYWQEAAAEDETPLVKLPHREERDAHYGRCQQREHWRASVACQVLTNMTLFEDGEPVAMTPEFAFETAEKMCRQREGR